MYSIFQFLRVHIPLLFVICVCVNVKLVYLLISFCLAQPLSSISLAISKWLGSFPSFFLFFLVFKLYYYNFWARIKIVVVVSNNNTIKQLLWTLYCEVATL